VVGDRLRSQHTETCSGVDGYAGGLTIAEDYVLRERQRAMFVPLRRDPVHAQADFSEALAVIGRSPAAPRPRKRPLDFRLFPSATAK